MLLPFLGVFPPLVFLGFHDFQLLFLQFVRVDLPRGDCLLLSLENLLNFVALAFIVLGKSFGGLFLHLRLFGLLLLFGLLFVFVELFVFLLLQVVFVVAPVVSSPALLTELFANSGA